MLQQLFNLSLRSLSLCSIIATDVVDLPTNCLHTVDMNGTTTSAKKPLGVRVTTEQHRIITEAAKREHRSVSSFVLSAALKAAEPNKEKQKLRFNDEEAAEIVKRAQDAFRKSGDSGRDLVEELFSERRAEAMRG